MLAAAEPYFWEFAVKVWRTEVAHSERYEFLIYHVWSQPLSGVPPITSLFYSCINMSYHFVSDVFHKLVRLQLMYNNALYMYAGKYNIILCLQYCTCTHILLHFYYHSPLASIRWWQFMRHSRQLLTGNIQQHWSTAGYTDDRGSHH